MNDQGIEFQIIHEYFEKNAFYDHSVALGIGDDCAIINPTDNSQQVISVDTSLADRHFPADADAFDIAYRSLNVSLSDLAAMGADGKWFTLAITLPDFNKSWLQQFSQGLFTAAKNAEVQLIGGDTTKGPLSITVQVQGEIPMGQALKRSGAQLGDYIYVSGNLGDAGAGLTIYQQQKQQQNKTDTELLTAYLKPEPQLQLGNKLRNIASSCIDISDGLLADLGHILQASQVGAEIDLNTIPLSTALLNFTNRANALSYALTAGDDYKLCFTSAQEPEQLSSTQSDIDSVYCIGRITDKKELILTNQPENLQLTQVGFDHFS